MTTGTRLPVITLVLLAATGSLHAKTTVRKQVAPGVELVQTLLDAKDPGGPLMVHAIIADLMKPGVRVEAALGGDTVEEPNGSREPLPATAARAGATAGVNGDFFSFTNGDPIGLHIHKGEVVSEPGNRSGIGFTADGRVLIGVPKWTSELTAPNGDKLRIAGLNRQGSGELILYAPIYGLKTPKAGGAVVTLATGGKSVRAGAAIQATVVSVTSSDDAVGIPTDGLVLVASGGPAEWLRLHLKPTDAVTISTVLDGDGKDWNAVQEFVSGGPQLLRGGAEFINLEQEGISASFSTTRHPRTAVGVRKDGRAVFAVLDGRQALSRGASLPETAKALKELGCVEAVNMDGGGSSTLWTRGLIVNSPSDGVTRYVTNSLLVFANTPTPASATTESVPTAVTVASAVKPGAALGKSANTLFGTRNGTVFVDQKGRLYGYKTGDAVAGALNLKNGNRKEWTVKAVPGELNRFLATWADNTLRITTVDCNGNAVAGQSVLLTRDDGKMVNLTTGDDGRALAPASWLANEIEPVVIASGKVERKWPDAAPAPVESKPPAAAGVKQVTP